MSTHLIERYGKWWPLLLVLPMLIGLGNFRLFDWDEVNFAECSREMLVTGQWLVPQIDYQLFWEKPPLFFWLQAGAMSVFGVGEWAARLPNVLAALASFYLLYAFGNRAHGPRFGILWSGLYAATLLPHLYFRSGIIDPVFNFFIFGGFLYFVLAWKKGLPRRRYAIISGLLVGGAVLTKGPVGFLLVFLAIGLAGLFQMGSRERFLRILPAFFISFLSIVAVWLLLHISIGGVDLFWKFISYQMQLFSEPVAGHRQPFWYHFAIVILGCFPVAIPALPALFTFRLRTPDPLHGWMCVLWWVVLVIFTIVTTKIAHYSSLAYFPMSYLGANALYKGEWVRNAWVRIGTYVHGVLWGVLLAGFPLFAYFRMSWSPDMKDRFASAQWSLPVDWQGWEGVGGLVFLAGWMLALVWFGKGRILRAVLTGVLATSLTLSSYALWVLPKIEAHTQATPIKWYERAHEAHWEIRPVGFKTYAHLFYGKKSQPDNRPPYRGTLTVVKVTNSKFEPTADMKLMEEKGGFRFYFSDIVVKE